MQSFGFKVERRDGVWQSAAVMNAFKCYINLPCHYQYVVRSYRIWLGLLSNFIFSLARLITERSHLSCMLHHSSLAWWVVVYSHQAEASYAHVVRLVLPS